MHIDTLAPATKIEAGDPEGRQFTSERLDAFPKKYRVLLHLQMAEKLSVRGLSDRTGIHDSTVQRRLSRGTDLLRKALAVRGIDAEWFLPA